MICSSSQCLVLFLGVSCESKSLFLGVWQHKDWLVVPDRSLSREVAESFGGVFPNR